MRRSPSSRWAWRLVAPTEADREQHDAEHAGRHRDHDRPNDPIGLVHDAAHHDADAPRVVVATALLIASTRPLAWGIASLTIDTPVTIENSTTP